MIIFQFLPNSFVALQCIFAEPLDFNKMCFFVILFCFQHQKIRLRAIRLKFLLNKCSPNSVKAGLFTLISLLITLRCSMI